MDEDKIKIKGKDDKIKIEHSGDIDIEGDKDRIEVDAEGKDVEIKGDKNIIEVESEVQKKPRKEKKDSIEIDTKKIKQTFVSAKTFLGKKKVLNILLVILLLATIFMGSYIRVQNVDLLKDQTTGEYIPTALDPFYFLRTSETIVEQGSLPNVDPMRVLKGGAGFTFEILPHTLVFLYKTSNLFGDYSLQYINIISPVIFFIFGLVAFFFLIYVLTNSKLIALISTFFLSVFPPYLHRTMAGFSDHESIGMFAFFLALIGYSLALKYLDREKTDLLKSSLFGVLVGFLSLLTLVSWGGVANFIFMIVPLSFFVFWALKTKKGGRNLFPYVSFYILFFISTILFGLVYGFSF